MRSVNDFKSNIYSQNGEDGMLDHVLDVVGYGNLRCVEFGAADGFFCSNTAALWHKGPWAATLIESDDDLYANLRKLSTDKVKTIHATVENIDHFIPDPVDVMSIDVDGEDYQIFDRMKVKHRVVVIEHNPTVPPHLRMINEPGTMMGSSALSLTELAESKGYVLVGASTCNLIFVRDESAYLFDDYEKRLDCLFDYSCLNYVVTDYHGGYQFVGKWPYGMIEPRNLGVV